MAWPKRGKPLLFLLYLLLDARCRCEEALDKFVSRQLPHAFRHVVRDFVCVVSAQKHLANHVYGLYLFGLLVAEDDFAAQDDTLVADEYGRGSDKFLHLPI